MTAMKFMFTSQIFKNDMKSINTVGVLKVTFGFIVLTSFVP